MAQVFDPVPSTAQTCMLCCYLNATSSIQVVRITNIQNWYFERVAFPGQRLIFETVPEAQLEVHTGMMASAILSDTIPCTELRVELDRSEEIELPVVVASEPSLSPESAAPTFSGMEH
jgi:hypothetical protein